MTGVCNTCVCMSFQLISAMVLANCNHFATGVECRYNSKHEYVAKREFIISSQIDAKD